MTALPGPRGCRLFVERAAELPLVWIRIAARGGSAADPPRQEGFTRHLGELSRRGAGARDRAALDEAIDSMGATFEASTSADAVLWGGLCLRRHADALVALAADVLGAPAFTADEHARLLRESAALLDEVRDDDGELAARFFTREVAPGHPYARTSLGTERSLERIDLQAVRDAHRRLVVPANLVIGFAGAVDDADALRWAQALVAGLPGDAQPRPPALPDPPLPPARRILLVDKPARTQSQIEIGHAVPAYGEPAFRALTVLETGFGGMFSSRLMQEIRVKRGWSYGAGISLGRARGAQWARIHLAPAAATTGDALALALRMFEEVAAGGLTPAEVDLSRRHLAGSLTFQKATAEQRLRLAMRSALFDLPDDFADRLPAALAAVDTDQVRRAAAEHLHPGRALAVLVATADDAIPRLHAAGFADVEVVAWDSY
ncbi:MAG TPA: pitrilysin family protein [Kofleriaceae bacterium]|nr:pitrilysin family protein [Kofleriaceae bacterium]